MHPFIQVQRAWALTLQHSAQTFPLLVHFLCCVHGEWVPADPNLQGNLKVRNHEVHLQLSRILAWLSWLATVHLESQQFRGRGRKISFPVDKIGLDNTVRPWLKTKHTRIFTNDIFKFECAETYICFNLI